MHATKKLPGQEEEGEEEEAEEEEEEEKVGGGREVSNRVGMLFLAVGM